VTSRTPVLNTSHGTNSIVTTHKLSSSNSFLDQGHFRYRCRVDPNCAKVFHRIELLERHEQRHATRLTKRPSGSSPRQEQTSLDIMAVGYTSPARSASDAAEAGPSTWRPNTPEMSLHPDYRLSNEDLMIIDPQPLPDVWESVWEPTNMVIWAPAATNGTIDNSPIVFEECDYLFPYSLELSQSAQIAKNIGHGGTGTVFQVI